MTDQEILKASTIFLKGNTKPYERHTVIFARFFEGHRVYWNEVPKGWYLYHIRHGDNACIPYTIEPPHVVVNFFGSILVSHPIKLNCYDNCFIIKEYWYGVNK